MLHVPWSVLHLDTIKTLIHEFGLAHLTSRTSRKNDLVKLLQSIEREGHSEVLRRLQAERDSERRDDHVEHHHQREREESPELEYSVTGPAPSTSTSSASISAPVRPVVEIPVRVHAPLPSPRSTSTSSPAPRFPRTRAKGKARARPSPSSELELELELQSDSSSPPPPPIPSLSHVGPPKNKKRKAPPAAATNTSASARAGTSSRKRARAEPVPAPKLPPVDLSDVPLPSYSILYQQRQSISQPRRRPWPRLNAHETFAGVEIVPKNLKVGKRPSAEGGEDVHTDGEEEGAERRDGRASRPVVIGGDTRYSVDGSERRGAALGARGTSTGTTAASSTASVTRRMEAVVVASPKAWKAKSAGGRRKTIIVSDDETDFEV